MNRQESMVTGSRSRVAQVLPLFRSSDRQKGFGVFNQLEPYLDNLLAPLGQQGERITDQVLGLVDNVRGSVLGGVGLAFFLFTAISMVQKVEESFNYTWYVSKPRSFSRRFTEYLVVLLVGPLLMVTAIGMLTSIQSNTVVQWIMNNKALGPVFVIAGKLTPFTTAGPKSCRPNEPWFLPRPTCAPRTASCKDGRGLRRFPPRPGSTNRRRLLHPNYRMPTVSFGLTGSAGSALPP